jgi:hypothetical protein
MANRHWRDRLRQALARQALPAAYVERLVEELSDHAADLSLEDSSMEAPNIDDRLGSPDHLAIAARREFQRRMFAGRHPALVFLGGPLVVVCAMFVASTLLLLGCCWLVDAVLGGALQANDAANMPPTPFEVGLMQTLNWVMRLLPFAASGVLFAALGRRSGRPIWGAIACGIVAVFATCFWSKVDVPDIQGELGTWTMGLGWPPIAAVRFVQAAVPLLLGIWMLSPMLQRARPAMG